MENNAASSGLRRRNSMPSAVVVPKRHSHRGHHHHNHQSSPSQTSFELVSLKSPEEAAYTSLKDLLLPSSPSSILSPTTTPAASSSTVDISSTVCGGYEISIRNRLLKQAAWAYLQPVVSSSSPSSSGRHLCFFAEFLRPFFSGLRRFITDKATRVYDCLVDALWLILCR